MKDEIDDNDNNELIRMWMWIRLCEMLYKIFMFMSIPARFTSFPIYCLSPFPFPLPFPCPFEAWDFPLSSMYLCHFTSLHFTKHIHKSIHILIIISYF